MIDDFIQGASSFTLTIALIPFGLWEGLGLKPTSGVKLRIVRRQFRNLFVFSGHWFAVIILKHGRIFPLQNEILKSQSHSFIDLKRDEGVLPEVEDSRDSYMKKLKTI